ncbi:MAG: helix-turn-helix domain-containing protein [Deltaproteobacteria bacterium]|nr:helix-turn-helix domain-containing protein [Deltaproteobacteria bacterium]
MKLTGEQRVRQKLYWFREACELGNVKLACRHTGISRKTYYKWWRIHVESGYNTQRLADRSRRPHDHPRTIRGKWKRRITRFRRNTGYGPARIWAHFVRRGFPMSPAPGAFTRYCAGKGSSRPDPSHPEKSTSGATRCPCLGIEFDGVTHA